MTEDPDRSGDSHWLDGDKKIEKCSDRHQTVGE